MTGFIISLHTTGGILETINRTQRFRFNMSADKAAQLKVGDAVEFDVELVAIHVRNGNKPEIV